MVIYGQRQNLCRKISSSLPNAIQKHPSEEIYTELLPYFKAIESRGFSEELSRLSNLFDSNNTVNFPAAYSATKQRIDRHFDELPLSDDERG